MEKLPAAKEFCRQKHNESDPTISWIDFNEKVMIEFAKMHVKAALKVASENAKVKFQNDDTLADRINIIVDRDSILNSYPLDNIK